jgi:hypothetical protein
VVGTHVLGLHTRWLVVASPHDPVGAIPDDEMGSFGVASIAGKVLRGVLEPSMQEVHT